MNVRDRILKRKQQRLDNQATQIDKLIKKKKNLDGDDEDDGEVSGDNNKDEGHDDYGNET